MIYVEIANKINEKLKGKKIFVEIDMYGECEVGSLKQSIIGKKVIEKTYLEVAKDIRHNYIMWQDMIDDEEKYINECIDRLKSGIYFDRQIEK